MKAGVPQLEAEYYQYLHELYQQFCSSFFDFNDNRDQAEVRINLQNGTFVFGLNDLGLRGYSKEDRLKYILPFEYKEDAKCPLFIRYLSRVLPDSKLQNILSEFIAYCFTSNSSLKLEKALILKGSGANGKSVFFEIVKALMGEQNISHYSLKNLTEERGIYRAKIQNKLLNYSSELGKNLETSTFKQLVSGEPVDARKLYNDPVTITNYARLMFNANELPSDIENNDGFFRRFLIVPFDVTIPEGERDPDLSKKIISEELSGIFNWVLEGLKRLLVNKSFTSSDIIREELERYRTYSDSVALFITENGIVADFENAMTLKEIYNNYKSYCIDCGYKSVSRRKFSERLRNLNFHSHRKNDGVVVYASYLKV